MSKESEARKIAGSIASDLRRLSEILNDNRILTSSGILDQAASQCAGKLKKADEEFLWSYEIDNLEFILVSNDCLRHCLPIKASEVYVSVSANIAGICSNDTSTEDPLSSLGIKIVVFGLDRSGVVIKNSWHLDRHPQKNPSVFIHPLYHFQYGGRVLDDIKNHGEHLILETPRIPHFPLDGILAIDFVLSNYYGELWSNLKEEPEYKRIIENSQKRLWRPYCIAAASRWIPTESDWGYEYILPQLLRA